MVKIIQQHLAGEEVSVFPENLHLNLQLNIIFILSFQRIRNPIISLHLYASSLFKIN